MFPFLILKRELVSAEVETGVKAQISAVFFLQLIGPCDKYSFLYMLWFQGFYAKILFS